MNREKRIRTLLVEPCPATRASLATTLARCGCEVTVAGHDEEAYESHVAGEYALAVVGVDRMPDQGFWLCRRLRSESGRGEPMILALSDCWDAGRLAWLIEAGVDDCLTTPPDEGWLASRVELARQRSGLRRLEQETSSATQNLLHSTIWLSGVAPYGFFRSSFRQHRFLQVNRALVDMLGYESEEELCAVDLRTAVHRSPADAATGIERWEDGQATGVESHWKRRDGSPIVVRLSGRLVRGRDGMPLQLEAIVEDITEKKHTEAVLASSEARSRALFEGAAMGILLCDRDTQVIECNATLAAMIGYDCETVLGRRMAEFTHPDDQAESARRLREFLAGESESMGFEKRLIHRDGTAVWCRVTLSFLPEPGSRREHVIAVMENVTEKKAATEAVEKEQESLRRMLELFERDRELIAFEIHDGFSQQLTGALLHFESAQQAQHRSAEDAQRSFDIGVELLRESIAEARRLVRGLRPPVLDAFGIVPAIEHLIEDHHTVGGGRVEFETSGVTSRLAHPLESALFRTVQETLNNARKYSRSDRIRIRLSQDVRRVSVEIRDWGVGFDPEKVGDDHFGLRGIRERARLLGGTSQIEARTGEGTRICVAFPLVEKVKQASESDGTVDE